MTSLSRTTARPWSASLSCQALPAVLPASRAFGLLVFLLAALASAAAQGLAPLAPQAGRSLANPKDSVPALPTTPAVPEGLKDKALTISIKATVPGPESTVTWQADSTKDTIPGTPVGVKLVGTNVAILLQLTPFDDGKGGLVLVTQGQVWVKKPSGELSYFTSLDTVAVNYGEAVYFFPLGRPSRGDAPMRVEVKVLRFGEGSTKNVSGEGSNP